MIYKRLFLSLVLLHSTICFATDQVWDTVVIDGKQQYVREHPLVGFWTPENRPQFDFASTANWKGYTTAWEIRDSALFLTSFDATINGEAFDPKSVFGTKALPVLAKWFTGKLAVLQRGFSMPFDKPHFASATLFLIEGGSVRQIRHMSRMRFELPVRDEFALKRDAGQFVVSNRRSDLNEIPEVLTGDVVHGLIDPNGFSINFTDESEELANALLRGDSGNEITLLLSTPHRGSRIRAVHIKREYPLRAMR